MKRKLLVLLLTLALAALALPMAAFAEGDVAQIGDKTYPTLQAAVDTITDNTPTTITLLASFELTDSVNVPAGRNITIEGAQNTITLPDSVTFGGVTAFNEKTSMEGLKAGTTLAVNNVQFQGNTQGTAAGHAVIVGGQGGVTVSLTGCTFTDLYDAVYCNHVSAADAASTGITITGSTFSNVAHSYSWDDGSTSGARVDKHNFTLNGNTDEPDPETFSVASVAGVGYTDLNAAIDAAKAAADNTVTLRKDVTADVVIPADTTVTLDLNGHKITNAGDHTIVNNGTLTITDTSTGKTGTVDNVTHEKAAVFNNGTMIINGGTFTRSLETQDGVNDGNDNSWYTVVNDGAMTINNGTFTTADGQPENLGNRSSLIRNGDSNASNAGENVTMTITGGTFTSAANVIKNEVDCVIESITGGTFTMDNSKIAWNGGNNLVQSYGTIKSITGGTFKALGDGLAIDGDTSYSRHGFAAYDNGKIVNIGGGASLTMEGGHNRLIRVDDNATVKVSGGSFQLTEPSNVTNQAFYTPDGTNALVVTGGSFSNVPTAYIAPGYKFSGNSVVADPWEPLPTATPAPGAAPAAGVLDSTPKTGDMSFGALALAGLAFAALGVAAKRKLH